MTIAPSMAIRNAEKLLPYSFLKWRPTQVYRQLKCRSLAREVLHQLTFGLTEDVVMEIFAHLVQFDAMRPVVRPEHRDET
jgi:hypothetical protein